MASTNEVFKNAAAPSHAPADSNSRRPSSVTSAQTIAEKFSHQYYTVFSNYPKYLHRFYDHASVQHIVEVTESGTIHEEYASSQKAIHDLTFRWFADAKARVDHISGQSSQNGGLMVQVMGTLFRRNRPDSSFVQSFFLAVQERGYFVLNDMFNVMPKALIASPHRQDWPTGTRSEGVPQPHTPRDANDSFGMHSRSGSTHEPNHLDQILAMNIADTIADTKEVLNLNAHPSTNENASMGSHPGNMAYSNKNTPTAQFQQSREAMLRNERSASPGDNRGSALFQRNPRRGSGGYGGLQRNRSIFVREIPQSMDSSALKELFEQFGNVTNVAIRTGKKDSHFAFVDFQETSAVEQALAAELSVEGKRLLIEEKKPLVLRSKPRFTGGRPGSDGSFTGMTDGGYNNMGGARGGSHFR